MLHYKGTNETLPPTPTPQPQSVQPWTLQQAGQIVMSSALLQVRRALRLACRLWEPEAQPHVSQQPASALHQHQAVMSAAPLQAGAAGGQVDSAAAFLGQAMKPVRGYIVPPADTAATAGGALENQRAAVHAATAGVDWRAWSTHIFIAQPQHDNNAPLPLAALCPQAPSPTLNLLLNITQPLMRQTGQLRWAINNVAGQVTPPCNALLDLVKK